MKEVIEKGLTLAFGLAVLGKEQFEKTVGEMVKKGEMTKEESKVWLDAIVSKGSEMEQAVERAARDYIKQRLKEQGLVTREEFDSLKKRVEALEQQHQQHQ